MTSVITVIDALGKTEKDANNRFARLWLQDEGFQVSIKVVYYIPAGKG